MCTKFEETESVTLINPDAVICVVNRRGQSAFFASTGSRTKNSYHHFKTRSSLITFISRLMHSNIQNLEVKIYVV